MTFSNFSFALFYLIGTSISFEFWTEKYKSLQDLQTNFPVYLYNDNYQIKSCLVEEAASFFLLIWFNFFSFSDILFLL